MVSEDGEKARLSERTREKSKKKKEMACVCLCAHVCACVAWWARFLQFFTGGDRR